MNYICSGILTTCRCIDHNNCTHSDFHDNIRLVDCDITPYTCQNIYRDHTDDDTAIFISDISEYKTIFMDKYRVNDVLCIPFIGVNQC